MNVHFIAIGGSAMHNLALALHNRGFHVTGSDDEIFEPARGRLLNNGLLPEAFGWFPDRIDSGLDAVIIGMHARADNPELIKAKELGLRLFSYPEYLYECSRMKKRVVIAGSHGKTTITAIILHVLKSASIPCDFMVGAQLEGFDVMVRLSEDAEWMVLEGDEYLSSPMDPRPKFHLYRPHIALLSGIAWDHINVFPTYENYVQQFSKFLELIEENGTLVYCSEDEEVKRIALEFEGKLKLASYETPPSVIMDGVTFLKTDKGPVPLGIFGRHNLQNICGAWMVCRAMGINDGDFLKGIETFKGASRRLQLIGSGGDTHIFKDFAHSPSKLKATIQAVKEQYPERHLVACLELHTYSSLNSRFLAQYRGTMDAADHACVYFSPHALELKKLEPLDPDDVRNAFGNDDILIFTDPMALKGHLLARSYDSTNLLMMSSGNFDGLDLDSLAGELTKQ